MKQSEQELKRQDAQRGKFYLVASGIALIIGMVWLYINWQNLNAGKESENWPTATGTILTSEVSTNSTGTSTKGKTFYHAEITYTYEVNGQKYTSDQVAFRDIEDKVEANRLVYLYPIDKPAEVYYNPDDPSESVLQPGTTFGNYIDMKWGTLFSLLGIFGICWVKIKPFQKAVNSLIPSKREAVS